MKSSLYEEFTNAENNMAPVQYIEDMRFKEKAYSKSLIDGKQEDKLDDNSNEASLFFNEIFPTLSNRHVNQESKNDHSNPLDDLDALLKKPTDERYRSRTNSIEKI